MSRVLIIGAGGVGRVVAHKCAQLPEVFSDIWLASRTAAKCEQIAAEIKEKTGRTISTAAVDADQVSELVALIGKVQPFMIINVALPYQDLTIMDACLETGVHYLDTANYEPLDEAKFEYSWQWAYRQRFEDAGLMALLGSGFDPGVTNVFCAYMQKHYFDTMDYVAILEPRIFSRRILPDPDDFHASAGVLNNKHPQVGGLSLWGLCLWGCCRLDFCVFHGDLRRPHR